MAIVEMREGLVNLFLAGICFGFWVFIWWTTAKKETGKGGWGWGGAQLRNRRSEVYFFTWLGVLKYRFCWMSFCCKFDDSLDLFLCQYS